MTTLYLDRKNLSLRADSSALVCYENDKRVATVPLKILQRVCIRGDLTLSAKVLGKLGETGIGVLILSGRQKRPALMLPNWKLDGQRRMAQYALSQDKSASLTSARNTVAAKLSAQLQHLQQMAFSDGLNADCLKEHSQALSNLIDTLANISDIPGLRGRERPRHAILAHGRQYCPQTGNFQDGTNVRRATRSTPPYPSPTPCCTSTSSNTSTSAAWIPLSATTTSLNTAANRLPVIYWNTCAANAMPGYFPCFINKP